MVSRSLRLEHEIVRAAAEGDSDDIPTRMVHGARHGAHALRQHRRRGLEPQRHAALQDGRPVDAVRAGRQPPRCWYLDELRVLLRATKCVCVCVCVCV